MVKTLDERDLRQEWETPTAANTAHWKNPMPFFDVVDREFRFQLDAAATTANTKCGSVIAHNLGLDALCPSACWIDGDVKRVWLNPGFSKPGPWMEKAYQQTQGDPEAVVVVMSLVSPSAKWWRDWAMKASEIRLIGGKRLQFVPAPGVERSGNMRENCLIIFRPNPHNLEPRIWVWDWNLEGE